jgi:hypothetical protein
MKEIADMFTHAAVRAWVNHKSVGDLKLNIFSLRRTVHEVAILYLYIQNFSNQLNGPKHVQKLS